MAGIGLKDVLHASKISSARRAARQGRWQDAAQHYDAAIALRPHRAATWLQRAHCHKQLGALDAAEDAYRRALALAPADFECNRQLAFFLRYLGKDQEAIRYFASAAFLDPSDGEIGQILRHSGLSEQAREQLAYATFLASPPRTGRTNLSDQLVIMLHRHQARKAARQGRWAVAVEKYEALLEHGRTDVRAWLQLGHAYRQQSSLPAAEMAYRLSVALAPNEAEPLLHLGYLLKDQGKISNAIFFLQQCLQRSPDHVAARQGLEDLNALSLHGYEGTANTKNGSRDVGAVPIHWGDQAHTSPPPLRIAPHLTPVTQAELDIFILTARKLTKGALTSNPS